MHDCCFYASHRRQRQRENGFSPLCPTRLTPHPPPPTPSPSSCPSVRSVQLPTHPLAEFSRALSKQVRHASRLARQTKRAPLRKSALQEGGTRQPYTRDAAATATTRHRHTQDAQGHTRDSRISNFNPLHSPSKTHRQYNSPTHPLRKGTPRHGHELSLSFLFSL